MRLEDIKKCHVCSSYKLTPYVNIPVPDMFTDEDIMRNVLMCEECDTMHYIEDGQVSYEFSCKINASIVGKKTKVIDE